MFEMKLVRECQIVRFIDITGQEIATICDPLRTVHLLQKINQLVSYLALAKKKSFRNGISLLAKFERLKVGIYLVVSKPLKMAFVATFKVTIL